MSFGRYPAYKDTGVEWLGQVPTHWQLSKLKSVATFSGGGTPSRDNLKYWNGDIPWVSPKDMKVERINSSEESITAEGLESSASSLNPPGRVLMVVRSGILKHTIPVAINETAVALNQDMKALSFDARKCGAAFFLRWVQGLNDRLLLIWAKQGATVESIEHSYLANTSIPLPNLVEQSAIISFLDRETSKIDALVAEQHRLIELLKEKRQAVISHAVTNGLNTDALTKTSGIEWLNKIPAHWRVVPLKRLAKEGAKTFADGDWIESPFITDDGFRLIQTGNVGIGFYKEQGFRYVSEETFHKLQCTEVKPRDVLICRLDGPVGRACLAPDLDVRMITSVDNAILKVAENISPEFVVDVLSSVPWISWIDALCRVGGGFRLRVSRSQLGELRVPVPPLEEQQLIARYLGSEKSKGDALIAEAKRLIDLLEERRTALISAAVTGQIDVRGVLESVAA
jgi:type I restriction enzyme S subunit